MAASPKGGQLKRKDICFHSNPYFAIMCCFSSQTAFLLLGLLLSASGNTKTDQASVSPH